MKTALRIAGTLVGDGSRWTRTSPGNGRMALSSVTAPADFDYVLEITDMGMSPNGALVPAPAPAGATGVTLTKGGALGRNPANRCGLFTGKPIGPDFEAGRANLKRISGAPAR